MEHQWNARVPINTRKTPWRSTFQKNAQGGMEKIAKSYSIVLQDLALYLKAVGYNPHYQHQIIRAVQRFFAWLIEQKIYEIEQVHRHHIKAWHEYLENRPNELFVGGLSDNTIRNYLHPLQLLFTSLQLQNQLLLNPMSGYKLPPCNYQEREILSLLEIEQVYSKCKSLKERCVLHIYYGLGLRRSEGQAINLGDVDYKNAWLYVPKGKGGKGRNMPLTKRIQQDFKTYILAERPRVQNSAFMLNKINKRMQGQSALRLLKKLLKRTNIDKRIDLHSLRHSIATHLIQQQMPIEQVRDYLGHRHLESTQRYVHYQNTASLFKTALHPSKRQGL